MSLRDWFRRAPSPVTGTSVGSLMGPKKTAPPRGATELLAAYSSMPWLRAITSRISYMVGVNEWKLYRGVKEGARSKASQTFEEVESHPFLDLLQRGSDLLSGSLVRQVSQAQIDLVGEAFFLFEVNGLTQPKDYYNIPPTWVKKIPGFRDDAGKYEILFPNESTPTQIPVDQVTWLKDPDAADPYGRGKGIAYALATELDIDEAAASHARDFFLNGARSDFIFIVPGTTKEQGEEFLSRWNSRHQGPGSSWKPAFLNREMKIEKLTQDFSGVGMVELRSMERDIIMQVYGLPPEIFGLLESSNRATIDAADFLMAKYAVVPRLTMMREPLQRAFDRYYPKEPLVLNYVSPVTEDKEFKKAVMVSLPWAFTVDEHRDLAGQPALPDESGNVFVAPFGLVPSDTPASGGMSAEEVTPDTEDDSKSLSPLTKITRADIARIVRRVNPKVLEKNTKGVIREVIGAFGKDMVDDLGVDISFDIENERVSQYLNLYSSSKITQINNTTKDKIRTQLTIGVEDGESIEKLRQRIQSVFDTASKSRARMIARTETVAAANFGNLEAMTQADIEKKEWLSTRDDATRDTHREAAPAGLDGQVRALDEEFDSSSGASAMYPGAFGVPEEDINCRCSVLPVVGKTSIANTEAKRVSLWKVKEASRLPFERQLTKKVRSAFDEQQSEVLTALDQSADSTIESLKEPSPVVVNIHTGKTQKRTVKRDENGFITEIVTEETPTHE